MAVSTFGAAAGVVQPYEQIFDASGTWTKPAGVKTVEVTVVGGSSGTNSSMQTCGAGGYYKGLVDVSAATTVPITVGAAGGGASAFGDYVVMGGSQLNSYSMGPRILPGIGSSYAGTFSAGLASYTNSKANGKYFAIYPTGSNVFYGTSPETVTANSASLPITLGSKNQYGVFYSWSGGMNMTSITVMYGGGYYAFFDNATPNVLFSTDAVTWSLYTAPANVYGLAYGLGKWVILTSPSGDASVLTARTTTDFSTWTAGTAFTASSSIVGGLRFFNNHFAFLDQAQGYYGPIMRYSTDGLSFSTVSGTIGYGTNPGQPGYINYDPVNDYYFHVGFGNGGGNGYWYPTITRFRLSAWSAYDVSNLGGQQVASSGYPAPNLLPCSDGKWRMMTYSGSTNFVMYTFTPSSLSWGTSTVVTAGGNYGGLVYQEGAY